MTAIDSTRFAQAITRLEERINRTVIQCQRFEAMCEPLAEWAARWSTATLVRWLNIEQLPLEEREKALVALALQESAEAGAALEAYQSYGYGIEHELLHQVARIEWEQRHQDVGPCGVACRC